MKLAHADIFTLYMLTHNDNNFSVNIHLIHLIGGAYENNERSRIIIKTLVICIYLIGNLWEGVKYGNEQ